MMIVLLCDERIPARKAGHRLGAESAVKGFFDLAEGHAPSLPGSRLRFQSRIVSLDVLLIGKNKPFAIKTNS
jgi:hypothetical protein